MFVCTITSLHRHTVVVAAGPLVFGEGRWEDPTNASSTTVLLFERGSNIIHAELV